MDTNEQTISDLRAALEREVNEARVRAERDDAQLNEISRINNELVNIQREFANVAESARQDAETVKVSEMRYRRLFESAQDGILILDAASGQIEDVNPYLCQLLGYLPDDFVGKQLWEIGTFRDIAANQDAFRTLQEKEYVRYDDLPLETKDGQSVSVEFVSNVYMCAEKKVVQCNIRDISGRKSAEGASALLAAIVESSDDAILSKTMDGIIMSWNAGAQALYGYSAEEAIGRPVSFLAPPDRSDEMLTLLDKIRRGEPVKNYETVRIRQDGSPFEVSLSLSPMKDAQGKLIGVSTIKRDITERKHAEAKLRESEAQKAAVFETALDCIISMDDTGHVIEFNPAAEKTFGYTRDEAIGQLLADLIIPPALREQHNCGLAHFLATGEGPFINNRIEVPAMRANGTEFLTELSISPVRVGGRTIFTGYLRDITERKQAELAEQESQRFLQSTLDALTSHIAVLDETGNIIAVNKAWRQFAEENDGAAISCGVGANYLEVCDTARGEWSEEAPQMAQGIHEVMAGQHQMFCVEYPCHSPSKKRWYNVCASRFGGAGPVRVAVAHENITERKLAEGASARLAAIVESSDDAIVSKTLDGIIITWNMGAQKLYGYTPQEAIGRPVSFLAPADLPDEMAQLLEKVRHGEPVENFETVRVRKDGSRLDVSLSISPLRDTHGNIIGASSIKRDITERKRTEAMLRESELRFRTLADSGQALVWTSGLDKGCDYFNKPWLTFTGRTLSQELGNGWTEGVHPDDLPACMETYMGAFDRRERFSMQYRLRRHDGEFRWIQDDGSPRFDLAGEFIGYIGHCLDVTHVKDADEALRKSRDQLELRVTERTTELEDSNRKLRDNEVRLLEANSIFTRLTRLRVSKTEELKTALQQVTEAGSQVLDAERCSVWLYNADRSAIECLDLYEATTRKHSHGVELTSQDFPDYFQALESGRTILADDAHTHSATHEFSEPYLKPLGIVSMLDTAIMVGGEMTGVLCCERIGQARPWTVEDETLSSSAAATCALALESYERARAETEMRRAKEEADAANAAKSEFLSRMSHELRTPLNAILGFGQILEMDDMPPKRRENVQYILKGGRHLLELINEVLDISRIEAGHLALSLEPVPVDLTVREVLDLVQPLTAAGNIRFINEIPPHSDWYMLADRQRLNQVLLNVISNAIKYNRDGGSVTVFGEEVSGEAIAGQAGEQSKVLRLSIRDTGYGLREDEVARLFVPFERLGAARTRIEGTGIGLALSKRLVEAMGGKIGLSSTPGEGSTFWIELPLVPSPLQSAQKQTETWTPQTVMAPDGRRKTVLYIEDNLANMQLIETLLEERPNVRLLTAMQGSTGLDLAMEHSPDLILLDLDLPDINGDEVLRRLRADARTRSTPVVMISADATPGEIERLLAAGAKTYLTKPLDVNQFLSVLDESLQGKR